MTINKFLLLIAVLGGSILYGVTHTLEKAVRPNQFIGDSNGNGSDEFIDIGATSVTIYEISNRNLRELWSFTLPEGSGEAVSGVLWDDIDMDEAVDLLIIGKRLNNTSLYIFTDFMYQQEPSAVSTYEFNEGTQVSDAVMVDWESGANYLVALVVGRENSVEVLDLSAIGKITVIESVKLPDLESHLRAHIMAGRFEDDVKAGQLLIAQGASSVVIGKGLFNADRGNDTVVNLFGSGTDLDNDGRTDYFALMGSGQIASNIWDRPVKLYGEPIIYIWQSGDEIIILRENGGIQKYYINSLSSSLTMVLDIPAFMSENPIESYAYLGYDNNLLFTGWDDEGGALVYHPVEQSINFGGQLINLENPDHVLYVGNEFNMSLEADSGSVLIGFEPDSLPAAMTYITDANQLIWEPTLDELGYHNILYQLKYRQIGEFHADTSDSRVSYLRDEDIYKKEYAHLMYVNEPPFFDSRELSYTVVNRDTLMDDLLFFDRNVDALFNVGLSQKGSSASLSFMEVDETADSLNAMDENLVADADSAATLTDNEGYEEIKERYARLLWVPSTDPGDYDISLWCSDGFDADTISAKVTVHPHIDLANNTTSFVAKTGQRFKYQVNFEQTPMSDSHSFGLVSAPDNMIIDSTGLIIWIPMISDIDTQNFSVSVTDGIDTKLLDMEVFVNERPRISSSPEDIVYLELDERFKFNFLGFDPNKDQEMKWSLDSSNPDIALDSQTLLWNANKLGHNGYRITVHDDIDTTHYDGHFYVNDPPVLLNSPDTLINAGDPFFHQIDAKDNNIKSPTSPELANVITFSLDSGPEEMKIMDNGDMLWRPSAEDRGYHDIKYTLGDGLNSVSEAFKLFVNILPTAAVESGLDVAIGDTLRYSIAGIDSNPGDVISYKLSGPLPFGKLDSETGTLICTPRQQHLGAQEVRISLADQHNSGNTDLAVPVFVYKPPVLLTDPEPHAFANIGYIYKFSAIDMNGDAIGKGIGEIKISSQPSLSIYNDKTQELSWTPQKTDSGTHNLSFTVNDSLGYSQSYSYDIEVYDNPCPPCDTNTSMNKYSKDIAPAETTNQQDSSIPSESIDNVQEPAPATEIDADTATPVDSEAKPSPDEQAKPEEKTEPENQEDAPPEDSETKPSPDEQAKPEEKTEPENQEDTAP